MEYYQNLTNLLANNNVKTIAINILNFQGDSIKFRLIKG
jgi:hypothetical protein